jgi:hypothetical protein
MPRYHINNETTEDTFDSVENLQDAIRIAREMAIHCPTGDPISIEFQGKNVRQYLRLANGEITERILT